MNQPLAEPLIHIERLSKRFGDFTAVDDVSLDVQRGEVFCLLGGSGCGKTTLLRMLAGFETPSAGRILIDGVDMAGVPPYARPVNMMFQSYALFPHMTVEQNVAFGLRQEGCGREEIAKRVTAMLDLVVMRERARHRPHQLSGGQKQRVALARALIKGPKLLLLDEPLAALDRKLREQTQFELLNIQQRLGVTFVVVTHDQQEAMTLATRIGVMNRGRIVQVGSAHELYEFPATLFVADFIGSVNLFAGRLLEDEPGHVLIAAEDLAAPIYVQHGISAAPQADVWVALRPEKLQIGSDEPEGSHNRASGVISNIGYLGDASVYLVRLDGGRTVRVTRPNSQRQPDGNLRVNDRVWLHWHESSCVVLTQ
jgi:putrescine transport system ATP-binding protein